MTRIDELILLIGITILSSFFIMLWIGDVNYALNDKRSQRKTIKLRGILNYIIPIYGHWHCSDRVNFKTYYFALFFGLLTIIQALVVILVAVLLYLFTNFDVIYLCITQIAYFIIVLLSGIIIRIKCNPDPNPFH